MELKERKILEVLKNHSINSIMIIVNFILLAIVFQTYVQFHFYYHVHILHSCVVNKLF